MIAGDAFDALLQLISPPNLGSAIVLVLALAVWMIGGEALVRWHYVRRGRRWSQHFSYLAFPFKDFDALEWSVAVLIVFLTLSLNQAAFALGR